jgi:general secretion pathway protein A
MYEDYYGFVEKPFTLTPDPKYLYKSQTHAGAFDLLRYAIRRREGFAVITGDIGTGKTTLCRALVEQIDSTTHTALVLNPFLSEEDLLKIILRDFGVISRKALKDGRSARVSKQALIDELYEFLLALLPDRRNAVVIIDEAQNLPLQVLEQIRLLSNLETEKEKLLQIVLVGQPNLEPLLRSPELRQLDQRISIRYRLKPLTREETAAYIIHRLSIAGGSKVSFSTAAMEQVHQHSRGLPRLINLICDRALLGAYSVRAARVTPDMVMHAVEGLEIHAPAPRRWPAGSRRSAMLAGLGTAAVVVLAGAALVTSGYWQPQASAAVETAGDPMLADNAPGLGQSDAHRLPDAAAYTILVASYSTRVRESSAQIAALTERLESSGFAVYYADVDLGARGTSRRVLAGAYLDLQDARRDEAHIKQTPGLEQSRALPVKLAVANPPRAARTGS